MAMLRDARIEAHVYRGARCDLHRGRLAGRPVAIKSARPVDFPLYGGRCTVGGVSTAWSLCCEAQVTSAAQVAAGRFARDRATLAAELLASEAAQLRDHGPAWGHQLVAIGDAVVDGAARPALATAWCDAPPLGSLPRAEQRRLLPTLLPALWDALADHPHGDVSPPNVLVDERPILIDPAALAVRGVELARSAITSVVEAVFTTTGWCYPLIPPHAVSSIPLASGASLAEHVRAHLASLTLSHHAPPVAVGEHTSMRAVGPRGRYLADTIELIGGPVDAGGDRALHGGALRARQPSGEPHPADLLALGIVYYELLTGAHPFTADRALIPAWVDVATIDDQVEGDQRLRALLGHPVVPPGARVAGINPAEDRLALALLALAVPRRDALVALAAGVAS